MRGSCWSRSESSSFLNPPFVGQWSLFSVADIFQTRLSPEDSKSDVCPPVLFAIFFPFEVKETRHERPAVDFPDAIAGSSPAACSRDLPSTV